MNTQNELQDFLAYFTGKNTSSIEVDDFVKFGLKGELKHYKIGQFMIRQGQLAPKIYFLLKGYVRYLSLSEDGKEFTQSFAHSPGIAGSTRAMSRKTNALFSIEVLDDVLCLEFDWLSFFNIMQDKPGFLMAYNSLLENLFIKKEEREYAFARQTAEQRYLHFLQENSQLRDKLPLNMIASHIGITPIALSRIRKKLT
ncbi:Crp/Fnr family transcriptional regulator [Shewanella sp. VB17]|uniref:Crp/Fnr family transcriptional regulator n=1 Tax=Shewanella sp. VB17 TaxID=2739432 RepID=UPI0015637392|nr:Crp/Fnr family transcriptional regulator [Shewanella sp. VB17]NRD75580.1 Crp/Fnr family transcriptional regulator [Shewanella sp. VB17]